MNRFAEFVMRGPLQAVSVAAATLMLGMALPPFAWLSSAVLALVALAGGLQATLQVALPALLLVGLAGWMLTGMPELGAMLALASWVPVLLLATVLRNTVRIDLTLIVAVAMGWLLVVGIHGLVADPTVIWREWLQTLAAEFGLGGPGANEAIEQVAPLMTGTFAASLVFSSVTALLLARWWQAGLYNPGGFGEEFRGLRLGRAVAMGVLAAGGLAVLTETPVVIGLALVLVSVYVFQGIAVVHAVVKNRGMHVGWLVGIYGLFVVLPLQMVLGLTAVGVVDAWKDLRAGGSPGDS